MSKVTIDIEGGADIILCGFDADEIIAALGSHASDEELADPNMSIEVGAPQVVKRNDKGMRITL